VDYEGTLDWFPANYLKEVQTGVSNNTGLSSRESLIAIKPSRPITMKPTNLPLHLEQFNTPPQTQDQPVLPAATVVTPVSSSAKIKTPSFRVSMRGAPPLPPGGVSDPSSPTTAAEPQQPSYSTDVETPAIAASATATPVVPTTENSETNASKPSRPPRPPTVVLSNSNNNIANGETSQQQLAPGVEQLQNGGETAAPLTVSWAAPTPITATAISPQKPIARAGTLRGVTGGSQLGSPAPRMSTRASVMRPQSVMIKKTKQIDPRRASTIYAMLAMSDELGDGDDGVAKVRVQKVKEGDENTTTTE